MGLLGQVTLRAATAKKAIEYLPAVALTAQLFPYSRLLAQSVPYRTDLEIAVP